MSSTPEGGRPPRRRRRRGKRRDESAGNERGAPPAHAVLPPRTAFDTAKPADLALSAEEAAELKQHFAFIHRYRDALRLKLNAAEDLLVNGARAPEDRGVCQHLLGKLDRATVNAALTRLKDSEQKTRFLGGVVRFTRDVAIVILYLESLSASAPRAEAAATLIAALRQIDFAGVSPAQLRRLLDLVVTLLEARDRPYFVLSLLRSATFRAAFDQAKEVLPAELAALFVPMRAVYGLLFGEQAGDDPEALRRGVELLLAAPASHVTSLSEAAKSRLLAHALDLHGHDAATDQVITTLLHSLPRQGRSWSEMATRRARQLLRSSHDDAARALLEELKASQPDYKLPGRWLTALAAQRVDRLALLEHKADTPAEPGLHRGLWLTQQRPIWVILGALADYESFASAAVIHRSLALPGLTPLLISGVGKGGVPFMGLPQVGEPVRRALGELRREPEAALAAARSGVEILIALALAGVALPDAGSERFLVDREGRLLLASLVGCRRETPEAALVAHLEPARTLVGGVLDAVAGPRAYAAVRAKVAAATALVALAQALVERD